MSFVTMSLVVMNWETTWCKTNVQMRASTIASLTPKCLFLYLCLFLLFCLHYQPKQTQILSSSLALSKVLKSIRKQNLFWNYFQCFSKYKQWQQYPQCLLIRKFDFSKLLSLFVAELWLFEHNNQLFINSKTISPSSVSFSLSIFDRDSREPRIWTRNNSNSADKEVSFHKATFVF